MFAATDDPGPPVTTTLQPGPTFSRTFDPLHHHSPVTSLKVACKLAHQQERAYLAWGEDIFIVATPHQVIATSLTRADVPGMWPWPGGQT